MFISLRSKLILVMSFVVAVATGTTSWVTQGYVERTYEKRFVSDFKAQVRAFSGQQLERLERVRKHCETAATNRVLVEALQSENKSRIRGAVQGMATSVKDFVSGGYGTHTVAGSAPATDLALPDGTGLPAAAGPTGFLTMENPMSPLGARRFGLGQGRVGKANAPDGPAARRRQGSEAMPEGKGGPRLLAEPLVGVLDAAGELLNSSDARLGFLTGFLRSNNKRVEDSRQLLKRLASRAGSEQEVTYRPDANKRVWEVIVTPIVSPQNDQPLGALIVGVPMPDLRELELQSFSQRVNGGPKDDLDGISSGLWLEGHLHTQTIPPSVRFEVADAVGRHIDKVSDKDHFHDIRVNFESDGVSVPHKVIFRVLNPDSPFPPVAQVCLYSMAGELAEVAEVRTRILSIGGAALAGALVLILLLTYRLTRPIQALFAATESVRRGDYDVSVPVTTHDEIGALATSFNQMTEGLRLTQKYQRVLAQVADSEVAERLVHNETALGGEMRDVTMLFCDIRGFTRLTATMPPDEVIALLNEHMTAMTTVVHSLGGVVDKFVGDMVMALFGAPATRGLDALRATRCALLMVLERDRLNAEGKWNMQVGIGIATGHVIAGCMGSEERLDYTVLGERVNLASRLCSQAEEGEVLIDETTLQHVRSAIVFEPLPDLALKGFPETVTAYRVTEMTDMALEIEPVAKPLKAPSKMKPETRD